MTTKQDDDQQFAWFAQHGNAPTLEEAALPAELGRLDLSGAAGGQGT